MSVEYLVPRKADQVATPFLVVCEGMSDARFVCSLLKHKGISTCSVGCPSREGLGSGSGVDGISGYLKAVRAISKGQTPSGILIMIDADDCPQERFRCMTKALKDAGFPAPEEPFSVEGGSFRVAIYLMPGKGRNGTLDCLLLEAALRKNPEMQRCIESFCDCTRSVRAWTENQQCKMKLSAIVAASCQKNPWASAAIMWSQKENPVPIDSECFREAGDFLTTFCAPIS
jgi:hypothetical protein